MPVGGWRRPCEELRPAQVEKAFAHYKSTRQSVLECLRSSPDLTTAEARLAEIGMEFAEAFNTLMERDMSIETVERDELLGLKDHGLG